MESRQIIIGDVHGCDYELKKLLEKAKFDPPNDQLLFTGDVINRGPNSRACIAILKKYGARSVLGNHEFFLIQSVRLNEPQRHVYRRMQTEFQAEFMDLVKYIKTWPLWIETDEYLLVHAGLYQGLPKECTPPEYLTCIRYRLDKKGQPVPWFEGYDGSKTLIFGHWAKLGGVIQKKLVGLDCGCVYGGALRAVIFPGQEIIEVPAQRIYFQDH